MEYIGTVQVPSFIAVIEMAIGDTAACCRPTRNGIFGGSGLHPHPKPLRDLR